MLAVARRADQQAFACLFRHFAPRVKGFMLRAGCEPDLAEAIAQETLVTVWRKAALFSPAQAAVSTWVFTIARNLRIDLYRRRDRLFDTVEQDIDLAEGTAPSTDSPIERAWCEERSRRIREALALLSAEQAMVVRMSFFEDYPHAQIAHALNLPLGTVKSRIRLAVDRLRRLLNDIE